MRRTIGGVEVRRLLRSDGDRDERQLVFVDSGRLTDRQREVLETAHEMGYFEHPIGANAGEVAEALGITTWTFTEYLAAAQSKIFDAILENWGSPIETSTPNHPVDSMALPSPSR